jgi:alpha-beta hydrolase superfamily lysophospholipase
MTDFSPMMLEVPSGAALLVRHLTATGEARGVVQINHGAAEHSGRYLEFAQKLSAAGFHVFAHDHRGHGGTQGPEYPPHTFGGKHGWDKLTEDIGAVHDYIRGIYPGMKTIIVGHSMGSIAGFDRMLREPQTADALALLGPVLQKNPAMPLLRALLNVEGWFKSAGAKSALFQALAWDPLNKPYKNGRTDYDWLSRDEAEVDAYIADPECGWPPTIDFAKGMGRGLSGTFDDRRLSSLKDDMPVLLMSGAEDTSTDMGKSVPELEARLRKAGLSDVESHIIEGMRHELHNEIGRDAVYEKLIAWCQRVVV